MGKKIYKLSIEPLTCVHIGTGKQLTLLDYTVKEIKYGENLYIKFSSDSILNRLAGDATKAREFEIASTSGNIQNIQQFFQKNFSINDDLEYPCETTKEFSATYLKNKNKDPYENAALVEQMYRPEGKKTPVIPGSSIKGSLRTAIMNYLVHLTDDDTYYRYLKLHDKKIEDNVYNQRKLENELGKFDVQLQKEMLNNYKDAKSDPFRAIEISDCAFPIKNSQIAGILKTVSVNQNNEELFISNSTQIQIEDIKCALMNSSEKAQCLLRLNSDLMKKNGVSKTFSISDIIKSCNYFFWREFDKEYKHFYQAASQNCDLIAKLHKELEQLRDSENQFMIRVGRWSQVEYITFDENFRAPKNKKYGTTRTLFNYDGQYLPLGWCKCTIEEVK